MRIQHLNSYKIENIWYSMSCLLVLMWYFIKYKLALFFCIKMTQKKVSYNTLILAIIATIFVCLLVYVKFDNIVELFSNEEQQTVLEKFELENGDSIVITWSLLNNGDVRYYPYTMDTQEYWIVWLKSKTINLSAYQWNVEIVWTVVWYNEDSIIVEAESISLLLDQEADVETGADQTNAVYLRNAGMYLPESFFEKYTLSNNQSKNNLSFSDAEWVSYAVNYFECSTKGSDTDCNKLKETFSWSPRSFTISNGMTFYKLAEVDSWFAANDWLFWYFFNDMPESVVIQLTKDIIFPTIKSVEQEVVPQLTKICTDGIQRLWSVDEYTLYIKSASLHLDVSGMVGSQKATCDVVIDYAQPQKALLTQFDIQDTTDETQDEEDPDTASQNEKPAEVVKRESPFDPNVEQFPINLEKPFVFNSNRDHSITFPSMNISFAGENVDTDLWFPGTRCYAQINVVSYPNKDLLKTQPSIILYECSRVATDSAFPTEYIAYPVVEWKTFVIHVVDGSRREFANNITIQQK